MADRLPTPEEPRKALPFAVARKTLASDEAISTHKHLPAVRSRAIILGSEATELIDQTIER